MRTGKMTQTENNKSKFFRRLGFMALLSLGAAVILGLVGYWPTQEQTGREGLVAMIAALAICVIGGWCGLLSTLSYVNKLPQEFPNGVMLGLSVRFAVTLGLAVAAILAGKFHTTPLLIWVGTGQLVILAVDVIGLAVMLKHNTRKAA